MSQSEIAAEYPGWNIDPAIDHTGWWKSQVYESDELARGRARGLIRRTIELFGHTDEMVAYVMHADFKRLMLAEFFADSLARTGAWPNSIYNTAVTSLEVTDHSIRLDQYNSTGHLPYPLWSR